MFYNNLLSIPILIVFSLVVEDWSVANLERNLSVQHPLFSSSFLFFADARCVRQSCGWTDVSPVRHCLFRRSCRLHLVHDSMVYPHDLFHHLQVINITPPPHLICYHSDPSFPPSLSMVGALNKLPVAASGMIFFGDPVTFGSVSAVLVGFVAGVVYAIAKTNQAKLGARGLYNF
jgi:GDP-mannose transporter